MLGTRPALGGAEPNAVLCKTYSVLLCVLELPRVDKSSAGPPTRRAPLGTIGPIGLRPGWVVCGYPQCQPFYSHIVTTRHIRMER